jgi:hypothetical protein
VPSSDTDKSKRFGDRVQFWKGKKQQGKGGEDGFTEVMWIRDLLVPMFKDARIATYSYKSDWRDRAVKTSLRQCAEQFLNILSQYRQQADVSHQRKQPIDLITEEYRNVKGHSCLLGTALGVLLFNRYACIQL